MSTRHGESPLPTGPAGLATAPQEARSAVAPRRRIPFLPNIFYGWWVLAAGLATTTINGATNTYGLGLFFVPLATEFGWSRASVAAALSLARLEGGMLGPLEGFLVDRLGPRKMMLVGIPLIGLGFFLLSHLSDLVTLSQWDPLLLFYGVYVLGIALGASIGTGTTTSTAVANWFIRRRGMAMGILSSGVGFGAGIYTPILGHVIQNYGWRQAALIAAWLVLAVGIPAAFVIRHRPEQYGMLPDGDTAPQPNQPAEAAAHQRRPTYVEENFTLRQALKTSAFWVIGFSFAMRIMVTTAVTLHLAPLIQDRGFTTSEAAWVLSALATLSIFGRIGLGTIGDRFERRKVYMWSLVPMAIGVTILAFSSELWHIALFLLLYAPCYGGSVTVISAMRGDYFGRRAFATIGGAMGPITTSGTVVGPLFAGYMFDVTGTYRTAMLIFAGFIGLNIFFLQLLKRPHLAEDAAQATTPTASSAG